jgi:hypothetical protein
MMFGQFLERGNPSTFTWLHDFCIPLPATVNAAFITDRYGRSTDEDERSSSITQRAAASTVVAGDRSAGASAVDAVDEVDTRGVVVAQIFAIKPGANNVETFAAAASKRSPVIARWARDARGIGYARRSGQLSRCRSVPTVRIWYGSEWPSDDVLNAADLARLARALALDTGLLRGRRVDCPGSDAAVAVTLARIDPLVDRRLGPRLKHSRAGFVGAQPGSYFAAGTSGLRSVSG